MVLANGLFGIVSMLVVRFSGSPYFWSRSLTLVFGFSFVYLAVHLFQRRRAAYWMACTVAGLAVVTHVGRGQHGVHALAPAVTLVVLVFFRRRFTVRSDPRSLTVGVALMLGSVIVALVYGAFGFWLLDRTDFGRDFTMGDALVRTLREFALLGNSDLVASSAHARWFLESLRLLGLAAGLFALYSLFRPVAYRLRTLSRQRAQVRKILQEWGRTSEDFFKLWPDKSYFFSADGRSAVAYRTARGVAVCIGDPVGPEECWEEVMRSFLAFCRDNGWEVALVMALPDKLPLYRRLGLRAIKLGEEALVDLHQFATLTAQQKEFRYIRRRFGVQGYRFSRVPPPHGPELVEEIEQVSREWLLLPGRRERSFAIGYFDRGYVRDSTLALVRDPEGRILAFANEVPSYAPGEATIDLMRHRLEVPNGTMDYLLTELLLALAEQGERTFNLGVALLAGVGEEPDASHEERAARWLADRMSRIWSFKGLRVYKDKFEPDWEDRYLIYQGAPFGLVRAVLAVARVME